MEKPLAIQIKNLALNSIENFSRSLNLIDPTSISEAEYKAIHKAIGILIGRTDMNLLDIIYKEYPELDHLANK